MRLRIPIFILVGITTISIAFSQGNALRELIAKDPSLLAKFSAGNNGENNSMLSSLPTGSTPPINAGMNNSSYANPKLETNSEIQQSALTDSTDNDDVDLLPTDSNRFETRVLKSGKRDNFNIPMGGANANYIIKPGDALLLSLWGEVEKNLQIEINQQGQSIVPGIGAVGLTGMTTAEAKAYLSKRLEQIYSGLKNDKTQLTLQVTRMSPVLVYVTGEAARPGSYLFPANATVFQALMRAHGPSAVGSVRNMILKRKGKSYTLDYYAFLFEGKQPKDAILRDGDILVLPKAQKLVEAQGELNRNAIFELKPEEGLADLIKYAGGPSPKASRRTLVIQRVFEDDRTDYVNVENASTYFNGKSQLRLQNFDKIIVFESAEEAKSYVALGGAIKYPGHFAYKTNMNLSTAIKIAGGFRSDAFRNRIEVYRTANDGQTLSFPVESSHFDSFVLNAKDSIAIFYRDSLKNDLFISISGPVRKPGLYSFSGGMHAKDLLLQAGGALPEWEAGKAQVERVNSNGDFQVIPINLDSSSFELLPKDRLVLFANPNYREQEVISLAGAFIRPGKYGKANRNETLVSFLNRVGEFKDNAYAKGAKFFRSKLNSSDTIMSNCITEESAKSPQKQDSDTLFYRDSILALCHLKISKKMDSLIQAVPIDLPAILAAKNNEGNIVLQHGDSLYIPTKPISVTVRGAVLSPGEVLYAEGESENYYIKRAGGYTFNADEDRIVISYANGEKTKAGWFTKNPDAGSEVFVADLPPSDGKTMQWVNSIGNIVLGLTGVILTFIAATN